ncbi:MAG: hypothetical protein ACD_11C00145G0018 [uncultured bacterium]|nr:MAG: hypothetical protein ACD_11C00145G0018 [uncultured bacterium]HBR71890.1 hypothetical protein [Candidatus Moranbacteria bacterium]
MKKNIVVVLLSVFFLAGSSVLAFAKTEYPVKEISGILKEAKVDTANSYTTIEFDDGRSITFKGVYEGYVFSRNKKCSFKYQYFDAMFSRGTYIVEFKCQE